MDLRARTNTLYIASCVQLSISGGLGQLRYALSSEGHLVGLHATGEREARLEVLLQEDVLGDRGSESGVDLLLVRLALLRDLLLALLGLGKEAYYV